VKAVASEPGGQSGVRRLRWRLLGDCAYQAQAVTAQDRSKNWQVVSVDDRLREHPAREYRADGQYAGDLVRSVKGFVAEQGGGQQHDHRHGQHLHGQVSGTVPAQCPGDSPGR
jgi:hypothetical protein